MVDLESCWYRMVCVLRGRYDEMSDVKKFKRGKIFLWRDPIFGRLGENEEVEIPSFEMGLRYNRLVVLLQDEGECDGENGILALPLTKNSGPSRISLDVLGVTHYVLLNRIFMVNRHSLISYTATVTPSKMLEIEGESFIKTFPRLSTKLFGEIFSRGVEEGEGCSDTERLGGEEVSTARLDTFDDHSEGSFVDVSDGYVGHGSPPNKIYGDDRISARRYQCTIVKDIEELMGEEWKCLLDRKLPRNTFYLRYGYSYVRDLVMNYIGYREGREEVYNDRFLGMDMTSVKLIKHFSSVKKKILNIRKEFENEVIECYARNGVDETLSTYSLKEMDLEKMLEKVDN